MNHDHDPLLARLQALSVDAPGAALSFTQRLARENGWPVAFAGQVVAELPETGDEGLDRVLRELALASAIPLEDQMPVIEAVHRTLQDRLADVEG